MMPGKPGRRTHDYLRHGITSLFAASSIADGTIISDLHRRHRAIEFRKFLTRIDKAVPVGLDVHLVCDNYATHNTAEIRTWLARHPRFHVHFTPTGPHRVVVDEPARTLVRTADRQADPPRRAHLAEGPGTGHQGLGSPPGTTTPGDRINTQD